MAKLTVCPDCRAEISKKAVACPRCGRKMKAAKSFGCCGVVAVVLAVGFVGSMVMVAVSPSHPRDDTALAPVVSAKPSTPTLNQGDEAEIFIAKASGGFIATDDAWDAMLDAENAKDEEEIVRLMARGEVDREPNGTQVKILKTGIASLKVRVRNGNSPDFEGWIQREFVRPLSP